MRKLNLILGLVLLLILSGCMEESIPSNDKVKLDFSDWVQKETGGSFAISNFKIISHNKITEDRIEFLASATYKVNYPQMDQFIMYNTFQRMSGGLAAQVETTQAAVNQVKEKGKCDNFTESGSIILKKVDTRTWSVHQVSFECPQLMSFMM